MALIADLSRSADCATTWQRRHPAGLLSKRSVWMKDCRLMSPFPEIVPLAPRILARFQTTSPNQAVQRMTPGRQGCSRACGVASSLTLDVLAQGTHLGFRAFLFRGGSDGLHFRATLGSGKTAPPGFGGAALHLAHVVADCLIRAHDILRCRCRRAWRGS